MKTKASSFDKKFDDGESVIEHLDLSKARRPAEGMVLLAPDVLEYFSDAESVNAALRSLIQLMEKVPARKYGTRGTSARQVAERK